MDASTGTPDDHVPLVTALMALFVMAFLAAIAYVQLVPLTPTDPAGMTAPANAAVAQPWDVVQGFQFDAHAQASVGHIEHLTIGGLELASDLEVVDLEDPDGGPKRVTGVASDISWQGGLTDPVQLSVHLSAANRDALARLVAGGLTGTDVDLAFTAYRFDNEAKRYYHSLHTADAVLEGRLMAAGGDTQLFIGDEPAEEVAQPVNYRIVLLVVPRTGPQAIHLAVSVSDRFAKQWGVDETPPDPTGRPPPTPTAGPRTDHGPLGQGFHFEEPYQSPVNHVEHLRIGGLELAADFEVADPEDPLGAPKMVVGVASDITWERGPTDPVHLSAQLSAANRDALIRLVAGGLPATDVELAFTSYEFDNAAYPQRYYRSFHTADAVLEARVQTLAGDLMLFIEEEPSMAVPEPVNYPFTLSVVPRTGLQVIHLAVSVSDRFAKQWGVEAPPPDPTGRPPPTPTAGPRTDHGPLGQGFHFEEPYQSPVNHVEHLRIDGLELAADFEVADPEDPRGAPKMVVGVASDIAWEGGPTDSVHLSAQLSAANRNVLAGLVARGLPGTDVDLAFTSYEFDPAADPQRYYRSLHTADTVLEGRVMTAGGDLTLFIGGEPSMAVPEPVNYPFALSVVPRTGPQAIHLAVSVSDRLVRQWGIG